MIEILLNKSDVLKTYKSEYHGNLALKRHKCFPVKASKNLAGIIADLMCDGHLQKPKYRIDYTSKNTAELERFGKEFFKVFGVMGKIRKCKTNPYGRSYNYGVNCKPVCRALKLLGVPTGQKVLKPFRVPNWILKDRECFRVFARRAYTCEGSVCISKSPWIGFVMHKEDKLKKDGILFHEDIRRGMMHHFGIRTSSVFTNNGVSLRKDGKTTIPLIITIRSRDSTIKFFREIGFDDKRKQFKLMKTINLMGPAE